MSPTPEDLRIMEEIKDRKVERLLDAALKICIPLLFACVGWTFNSISDINTRLAHVEATRYTKMDAASDLQMIRREIQEIQMATPPSWFRERVEEINKLAKENSGILRAISERLAKLESK